MTEAEIERWRLDYLAELYACGKTTLEQHERYAMQALQGEQPTGPGLPVMPDPALFMVSPW